MKKNFGNMVFLLIILLILIGILKNPQLAFKAGSEGLMTWVNLVLPSLLPFFIISEVLISIGFVDIIGKFLEPLMKHVFNLPGISTFPFSMSIVSGYPVGGKILSNLKKENRITKEQAERTLIISSTSGPLFMLGSVAVGMLNNSKLAPLILYPHYIGAITLGLIYGFKTNKVESIKSNKIINKMSQLKNHQPMGFILMNSVKNSMNSLFLIGGFIIFYTVVIELFLTSKFMDIIYHVLPIDKVILQGLLAGIIEITTGCKKISNSNLSLIGKITIINFLIGWSGISIHSQVLAFLSGTDVNSKRYILAKFFHGILSSVYGFALYKLKYKTLLEVLYYPNYNNTDFLFLQWPMVLVNSIKLAILMVIYLLISSLLMILISSLISKK